MDKKNVGFFVGCKYSDKNDIIYRCIDSIAESHPKHDRQSIVIVDSDSEDLSYGEYLSETYGIKFDKVCNKNYTTGMIWYAYKNYDYDFYFFLHDSTEVQDCLYDLTDHNIVPLMYWDMVPGVAGWWDSPRQRQFAIDGFEMTDLEFKEHDVRGIFGPMFGISRKVLDILYNKKFNLMLPTDKEFSTSMERAWGIAISQIGLMDEIKNNAIIGPYRGHSRNDDRIRKHWLRRE